MACFILFCLASDSFALCFALFCFSLLCSLSCRIFFLGGGGGGGSCFALFLFLSVGCLVGWFGLCFLIEGCSILFIRVVLCYVV